MTVQTLMFMLGITTEYGINVFQVVVALWFFSVGYLLYKRAKRALCNRRSIAALDLDRHKLPCLTAESYPNTGM